MLRGSYTRYATSADMVLTDDGVLIVTLEGPLTDDGINSVKRAVVDRYGDRVKAFVVDFKRSLIALDGSALDAMLEGEQPGAAPRLPAALLVRPDMLEMFAGHALRIAQHAIMRRVFLDEAQAVGWAAAMARRQQPRRASSRRGP